MTIREAPYRLDITEQGHIIDSRFMEDPFITTTIKPRGWRYALGVLLGRYTLVIRVRAPLAIEDAVLAIDPDKAREQYDIEHLGPWMASVPMNESSCPRCHAGMASQRNLCPSCAVEPENIQETVRRIREGAIFADKRLREGDTGFALAYIEGIHDNANELLNSYEELAKMRAGTA